MLVEVRTFSLMSAKMRIWTSCHNYYFLLPISSHNRTRSADIAMQNRISQYLTNDPHPLDLPEFADRQRVLRMLCLGLIAGTIFTVIGFSMVVRFALGGQAIAQNGALLAGIPILTVVGAFLTLTAVAVSTFAVIWMVKSGIRRIATEPIAPPDTEADQLWKLYSQCKFTEYGLADGAIIITVVLFHLSADWLMIGFIAGLIVNLVLRFPSVARTRAWFDAALKQLETEKSN
jgi:hypothetical protein